MRRTVSLSRADVAARRSRALDFAREYLAKNLMPPTLHEINIELGLRPTSVATVNGYMEWHVRQGNARKVGSGAHTRYMPVEVCGG